jgi:uncharacterized protein with PIN domain
MSRNRFATERPETDARLKEVDETLAAIRLDLASAKNNLEECKAKVASDTDQAVNALNARIDLTNKNLATTQESVDEVDAKSDTKVCNVAWRKANDNLDAEIRTGRDMVSKLWRDVDARHGRVDGILVSLQRDLTAMETSLEESKAKTASDTDRAVNELRGCVDSLERNVARTEARLENDIRRMQQQVLDKIGAVEHRAELRSTDSRCLKALVKKQVGESIAVMQRDLADTEAGMKSDTRRMQQEAFEKIESVETTALLPRSQRSAELANRQLIQIYEADQRYGNSIW